jgi:hypothetical protein
MQLFSYLLLFFTLGVSVAAAPFRTEEDTLLEHINGDGGAVGERRPSFSGLPPYEPPTPPDSPHLPPARPPTPVHVNHDDRSSHLTRRGYPPFGDRTKVNLDHWSRMYLPEGWVRNFFLPYLQASDGCIPFQSGTIAVWDANMAIPQICAHLTCMREI